MKKNTHPIYYKNAKVKCACGNEFSTGSTVKELHIEICSQCHPFFTGKQKLVDTARRVDKFQKRLKKTEVEAKRRKGKKIKRILRAKAQKDKKQSKSE